MARKKPEVEEVNTDAQELRAKVQLKVDGQTIPAGAKFAPTQEVYDELTSRADFDEIASYVDAGDDEDVIVLDNGQGDDGLGEES